MTPHCDDAAAPAWESAAPWAVGATLLISVAPMAVLPLLHDATGSQPLLICFAAGSMLGDVFLHILPESFGAHDHADAHADAHADGHSHGLRGGLTVLAGFLSFYLVEKLVRSGGHAHDHAARARGARTVTKSPPESQRAISPGRPTRSPKRSRSPARKGALEPVNAGAHADGAQSDHGRATDRRVTGYLNLAADAAHNFTDGALRIDGTPRAHPAR